MNSYNPESSMNFQSKSLCGNPLRDPNLPAISKAGALNFQHLASPAKEDDGSPVRFLQKRKLGASLEAVVCEASLEGQQIGPPADQTKLPANTQARLDRLASWEEIHEMVEAATLRASPVAEEGEAGRGKRRRKQTD